MTTNNDLTPRQPIDEDAVMLWSWASHLVETLGLGGQPNTGELHATLARIRERVEAIGQALEELTGETG